MPVQFIYNDVTSVNYDLRIPNHRLVPSELAVCNVHIDNLVWLHDMVMGPSMEPIQIITVVKPSNRKVLT